MKKRLLALLLVFAMLLPVFNVAAFADDDTSTTPRSVTVYFSLTDDGSFVNGLGMKKITVPYFDIGKYGLSNFYFKSERYTSVPGWEDKDPPASDLTPGTKEYAEGQITMLHLFIYALEVYKLGCPESLAGTGKWYEDNKISADDLTISGSAGSMFLYNYWGMDYNLNYYRNYEYPLASDGWGATADQILLHDGDVITMGHFSSYSFFNEPNSIFGYAQDSDEDAGSAVPEITSNGTVNLTFYHAGADNSGNYTTAHTPFGEGIKVYRCKIDAVPDGLVNANNKWTSIGETDADGAIEFSTSGWDSGTYLVAMAGQKGITNTNDYCCTSGGIRVVVQ